MAIAEDNGWCVPPIDLEGPCSAPKNMRGLSAEQVRPVALVKVGGIVHAFTENLVGVAMPSRLEMRR